MANEVVKINKKEKDDYLIKEIAEHIFNNTEYEYNLKNGVPQKVTVWDERFDDKFYCSDTEIFVHKGQKLGWLYLEGANRNCRNILATHDGKFYKNKSLFRSYPDDEFHGFNYQPDNTLVFGTIYFPEYDFYKENQRDIDTLVKQMREAEKERQAIEEQRRKDEEERILAKQISEQSASIDTIENTLVMLDMAIQKKEVINVTTLQGIESALLVLVNQKNVIKNLKQVELLKAHFENAHKEYKKYPELSNIVEQRMLKILDMFYDILGKSEEQRKSIFAEMIKADQEKKISETIRTLQISIEQRILPDISSLQVIEGALSALKNYKDDFQDLTSLVQSKKYFSAIYKDCVKLDCLTSTKTRMKEISKSFDELLNKKPSVWEKVFRR
jgi:hypothetical protein